jgi:hypothetical protein
MVIEIQDKIILPITVKAHGISSLFLTDKNRVRKLHISNDEKGVRVKI